MPASHTRQYNHNNPPQWTPTGYECHTIAANCDQCPIHTHYGFHKDYDGFKHCDQHNYNQMLIAEKIQPHRGVFHPENRIWRKELSK